MKFPININNVTISNHVEHGPRPSLGFVPIDEENNNAGDYYGLYWELGKETKEPIVCWHEHEIGILSPKFPNLDCFIRWLNTENKEAFKFKEDEEMYFHYFNRGKLLARKNDSIEAIKYLEYSINIFGEYFDSWHYLSLEYKKLNKKEKSAEAAINIIKSNWAFGVPSQKAIDYFTNQENFDSQDPLYLKRHELGIKNNYSTGVVINFKILKECIDSYHVKGDYRSSALLNQNFAYLMEYEKFEIQKANNFNLIKWQKNYIEYCKKHLNNRKYSG